MTEQVQCRNRWARFLIRWQIAAINKWLDNNGFSQTRVNSRTPGRQADWEKYGWGQTISR